MKMITTFLVLIAATAVNLSALDVNNVPQNNQTQQQAGDQQSQPAAQSGVVGFNPGIQVVIDDQFSLVQQTRQPWETESTGLKDKTGYGLNQTNVFTNVKFLDWWNVDTKLFYETNNGVLTSDAIAVGTSFPINIGVGRLRVGIDVKAPINAYKGVDLVPAISYENWDNGLGIGVYGSLFTPFADTKGDRVLMDTGAWVSNSSTRQSYSVGGYYEWKNTAGLKGFYTAFDAYYWYSNTEYGIDSKGAGKSVASPMSYWDAKVGYSVGGFTPYVGFSASNGGGVAKKTDGTYENIARSSVLVGLKIELYK